MTGKLYTYSSEHVAFIEHVNEDGVARGLAQEGRALTLHLHIMVDEVIHGDLVFIQQLAQNLQH